MKTFLTIYAFIQSYMLIYWLYIMLTTKPTFIHDKNRFLSNWYEGGYIALFLFVITSLVLSYAATRVYLWVNFLEK